VISSTSKKYFLAFHFLLLSAGFVPAQVALDSMLTACYPFTGDAQDMSGNNHHGTVFGATLTADRFGNLNSAYHFNGVNSYIEVQHFDSLVPTDEISVSFWCRVRTFASHAQFQLQPDNAGDRFNISLHYSHNGIPSTFWDYGSIYSTGRIDTLGIPFVTQWEHYVFISSASQNFMAEYKDGVLLKRVQQHDVIVNKNKPFWIGSGSTLACMHGEMDDIRFYNRVLNDSEIVALYLTTDACSVTLPAAGFESSDTTFCQNECIDFTNFSVNATSFQWIFPGGSPAASTDVNPSSVCYNNPGTFDVTLIASNAGGTDTLTLPNFITVIPYTLVQGIQQVGDTLVSNQGFVSYQWYYNGNIIAGATDYFYVAQQNGDYNVICIDENGCQVEAVIFNVLASVQHADKRSALTIFPNPVSEKLSVIGYNDPGAVSEISVYNVLGEKIYSAMDAERFPDGYRDIDCRHFSPGTYWLDVITDGQHHRLQFLKN